MQSISMENVYKAILILSNPADQRQIPQADSYLRQCQKDSSYLLILLQIFKEAPESLIKQYAFVIFARVVKDNWNDRGNKTRINITSIKQFIKDKMMKCLELPLESHPFASFKRLVTDLVCKMANTDYPTNWEQLHSLGVSTLQNVVNSPTEDNIWLLRVFKKVWKQKMGKCIHKEGEFQKFAVPVMKLSFELSSAATKSLSDKQFQQQEEKIVTILLISRYVDSILLSTLLTIDKKLQNEYTSSQFSANLASMVIAVISKLDVLYTLFQTGTNHRKPVQKNIQVILQHVSTFQSSYPFVFHTFLSSYFQLIITFLSKAKEFKEEATPKVIIGAFTNILRCVVFYFSAEQFSSSIFSPELKHLQPQCHETFIQFFNKEMISNVFKSIVVETLNIEVYNIKDSVDQEESEGRIESESLYLLICGLLKELMKRFKDLCLEFINELFSEFLKFDEQTQCNVITVLLVAPKIYGRGQIPINNIFQLLQYLSTKPTMHKQFALICNRYSRFLVPSEGQQILNNLIHITVNSSDVDVICEAAFAIKKVLSQQTVLDLSNLHQIVVIIISVIYKTDDPTLRWYLVQLIGTIVSEVEFESEFISKCIELEEIETLCKEPTHQTLVYSTCDMLMKFLGKSSSQRLTHLVLLQIQSKIGGELDSPEVIYNLWLEMMKRFKPSEESNKACLKLFQTHGGQIQEDFPVIYCDLIIYYLLYRIISPPANEIVHLVTTAATNPQYQHSQEVKSAYFQLFLVFSELNQPNLQFPTGLMTIIFKQLIDLADYGSTMSANILRSSLVSIVNLYITQNLSSFSTNISQTNPNWIDTWLQNTKSLHSKYAYKLNALALIITLNHLSPQVIARSLNSIMKSSIFHLQPIDLSGNDKKELIEIRKQVLTSDLKPIFKEKLIEMMKSKGISEQWILGGNLEKTVVNKLKEVLQN